MKAELIEYRQYFKEELFSILDYWIKYSVDSKGDGFYGAVDMENKPVETANKSCVLTSRILWTFSEAARIYEDKRYADIAELAYRVINNHFKDRKYGGYFMELSPDNNVINDIKHTYSQAFVIYSLCKYYELTRSDKILNEIIEFYTLLNEKTADHKHPGYFEAFTRSWKQYTENRMADNNEPKSMNTHLHLLEAYSALYKILRDDNIRSKLSGLLEIFTSDIIRDTGHLGIFFDNHFKEVESSKGICSFGHDIEASWLIWEAAENLGDRRILEKVKPMVTRMADSVLRSGVDKDGGLFLESSRYGSHLRTNKHWWPQAETLVGFMNMYQLTGDDKYWETTKLSWHFINNHIIDHERGEWFTKVNRLGKPYLTEPEDDPSPYYRNDWKIDPWKCPYHNGRAMMEMIARIDKLKAKY